MNTTGGRFELYIGNRKFAGRGTATLVTSGVNLENGANQDGSAYRTVKPQLCSIDLTFDRGVGLKWDEAMLLEDVSVTFKETDAKRTHTYTDAAWSGSPSISTESGEVSGLKLECAATNYAQQ